MEKLRSVTTSEYYSKHSEERQKPEKKENSLKLCSWAIVMYSFNSRTKEAEAGMSHDGECKASVVYRASSRTVMDTQRETCLKNKNKTRQTNKQTNKNSIHNLVSGYMTVNIESGTSVMFHTIINLEIGSHQVIIRGEKFSMKKSTTNALPKVHTNKIMSKYLILSS